MISTVIKPNLHSGGSPRSTNGCNGAALTPVTLCRTVAATFLCAAALHQSPTVAATPSREVPDTTNVVPENLIGEIDHIVRHHYYSQARLASAGWDAAVSRARSAFDEASASADQSKVLQNLLATLGTSHTTYYPPDDPAYWQMAGIFEPVIERVCKEENRPEMPITVSEIGVFWKRIDSRWYVGGIYDGSAADVTGLRVGDEIVSAGGSAFSPVITFARNASSSVALEIRRSQGGPVRQVTLSPQRVRPHEALRAATENSWRIIPRGSRRIAYLRVWSWTSAEIQQVVVQAVAKSNQASVDAFVLDLRDGWGGASPHYLSIFDRDVPILESIDRAGDASTYDTQIRKPTVILINGGTRSGKEIIAYGAKKHGLATLVGEKTAGAVLFGQPFCLSNRSLLYLAVADARVDGQQLEGRGIEPDIEVAFDVRYADGRDPQMERALDLLQ